MYHLILDTKDALFSPPCYPIHIRGPYGKIWYTFQMKMAYLKVEK